MRKFYLLLLACIVLTGINAQLHSFTVVPQKHLSSIKRSLTNGVQTGGGGCDTLNLGVLSSTPGAYPLDPYYGPGILTGTNALGNLGNAQYFDASSLNDNYLSQAFFLFVAASTDNVAKVVPIDVYDGTGDVVGAKLGTTNLTMQTIINDVDGGFFSQAVFNPAIQLPASKQFFVAVNYSNLTYTSKQYDTIALSSTDFNQGSGAWQNDNALYVTPSGWRSFVEDWTEDVGLFIFPLLSPSAVCGALPVHLTSFTAQSKGADVLVNWQVTQELNMSAYDVERAGSNLQFTTAGTVAATNAQLDHSYSFTDPGAASTAGGLFYRLKQVNKDGSFTYSNIVKVNTNSSALTVSFANPISSVVQLHINSPVSQKIQGGIYDLLGRKVATLNDQVLSTGDNTVTMPTGTLPKGVYILNLLAGGVQYKYKIVTQ
jgi:hypothetical protein